MIEEPLVHESVAEPTKSRSERMKFTMKELAHMLVRSQHRRGLLINPGRCSKCRSEVAVNGHHNDYSRPLDVRWLCQKCHLMWHRENGPGANADTLLDRLTCENCSKPLPINSQRHKKFCSTRCRRESFTENANEARIAAVRRLKSGKMSVVVHMADSGLRPGDQVKVGK